jgi:YD repeat-containing protein
MIDDVENLKSDISQICILFEVTVPRWAADEPVPGQRVELAPLPSLSEEGLLFQTRRQFQGYSENPLDVPPDPLNPLSEVEHTETIYNEHGYITDSREFEDNTLVQRTRYSYNDRNLLIRKTIEDTVDNNIEIETYQYDSEDQVASKTIKYTEGSEVKTYYRYGLRSVEERTVSEDGIESTIKRTYADGGLLQEYTETDPNGNVISGEARSYDAHGRLTEIWVLQLSERWLQFVYEYDSSGNEIRWSELSPEGKTLKQRESTFEGNRCISDVLYETNNETRTTFEYDSEGRLTRTFSLSEVSQSETVSAYNEDGLLAMTATRTIEDKRLGRWGGIYPIASTTWWEYDFYETNELGSST